MITDNRIDAYIDRSNDFARPVLAHLRQLVQKTCPEARETIKWGMPHFEYKKKMFCAMASFKSHCAFIIHNADLLEDPDKLLEISDKTAMGSLGRITSLTDLPKDEILQKFLHLALKGIDNGTTSAALKKKRSVKSELTVPEYFSNRLELSPRAKSTFEAFSYSDQKEYIEWITEAKTDATMVNRLNTAIQWLEEGKRRNWKYLKSKK